MTRPKKVDLTGMSPIRRDYHDAKARNAAIDEFEAYLVAHDIKLPEEVVVEINEPEIATEEISTEDFEVEVPLEEPTVDSEPDVMGLEPKEGDTDE